MKRKVISIILIILLLTCGGLAIYGVTKRPVGSMPSTGNADQQIAASEKAEDQMTPDDGTAATQEATATPATTSKIAEESEATAAPAATPKASEEKQPTAEPEATAAPTAMPKTTKQPEATAAPTATPKATKQPEATAAPPATPAATKQPEATAAPTATPAATKQPTGTPAPNVANPPAQVHTCTWDGGSVTQAATCSSEGVKTYTCTSCGKTKTESIAKTDHSYVTEKIPATCTEYGQDRTYCSVCGYEKSKVANSDAPKGHQAFVYKLSYGGHERSCTGGGSYDVCCGICGAYVEYGVGLEPLGHDLQNPVVVQEASCNAVEITQFTCGRCGETIRKETRDTNPDNHDWEERTEMRFNYELGEEYPVPYRLCHRCYKKEYY